MVFYYKVILNIFIKGMVMFLIDVLIYWFRLNFGIVIIKRMLEKMYDDLFLKCFGIKIREVVCFGYWGWYNMIVMLRGNV